ncbi:MAG: hypothetical protein HOU81_00985 [Hamadaea sp.]|uniref:hypothetical protein n=1 Tax=Hamadaea sp. TaxID=2024425 RepID=UPI0018150F5F|nr:hypothetical protein [Hamadaea sp.]NUR69372.1 hypothetical protein [Hamadaea sp.]NUT23189.1 hypothetical protein [Hamadaea sp.]
MPYVARLRWALPGVLLKFAGVSAAVWFLSATLPGTDAWLFSVINVVLLAFLAGMSSQTILSSVFRVPAVHIDREGIRFPLIGVALPWDEVDEVDDREKTSGGSNITLFRVIPVDDEAVLRQMHFWLRRQGRAYLERYGTPIVFFGEPFDQPLHHVVYAAQHELERSRETVG